MDAPASALGHVFVTYKTPSILPKGGKDIVKAANAPSLATATKNATMTRADSYSFAAPHSYTAEDLVEIDQFEYLVKDEPPPLDLGLHGKPAARPNS